MECRFEKSIRLRLTIEKAKEIIPENEIYLSVHKDNPASLKVQKKTVLISTTKMTKNTIQESLSDQKGHMFQDL